MDSVTFLQNPGKHKRQPVYVVHGDEDFLKRQVLAALRRTLLESEDDSFGLSTYAGDKAVFAEVHDELQTLPFTGPRRMVVVESADPFVTTFRSLLEKYVSQPAAAGVLVLDVKTWPANTRLAKMVSDAGTLVCKALQAFRVPDWCVQWGASHYGKQLGKPAAALLVDLVGPELGLLDQELNKLAIYVGAKTRIDNADVDKLVGQSRAESTWKIFDAIAAGQPAQALDILERLFDQGEDAMRMLGAFSMQLRRLARIGRLGQQGQPLSAAMNQAGVPPFAQRGLEQQLRHLGRRRLERLYDWLIETDQGLKGYSQLPPRTQLERLVVRLARPA